MGHARDAAHRDRVALARRRRRIAPCACWGDAFFAAPWEFVRRAHRLFHPGPSSRALPHAWHGPVGRRQRDARARRDGDGAYTVQRVFRSMPHRRRRRDANQRDGCLRPRAVPGAGRRRRSAGGCAHGYPQRELWVGRAGRGACAVGRLFRNAGVSGAAASLRGARRDVWARLPACAAAVCVRLFAEDDAPRHPLRTVFLRRSVRRFPVGGRPTERGASIGRAPRGRRGARGGGVRRWPRGRGRGGCG